MKNHSVFLLPFFYFEDFMVEGDSAADSDSDLMPLVEGLEFFYAERNYLGLQQILFLFFKKFYFENFFLFFLEQFFFYSFFFF